jgi:hypothetical protein
MGSTVNVVAKASSNDGVEDARFQYGSTLPRDTIQGHPACRFVISQADEFLGAVVTFAPGATGGRYDLFEESGGQLIDLNESIVQGFGPIKQLRILGIAALARAAVPRARRLQDATAKKKQARKAVAKKSAPKKSARKKGAKTAKKAVRKTAGKVTMRRVKGAKKAASRSSRSKKGGAR